MPTIYDASQDPEEVICKGDYKFRAIYYPAKAYDKEGENHKEQIWESGLYTDPRYKDAFAAFVRFIRETDDFHCYFEGVREGDDGYLYIMMGN